MPDQAQMPDGDASTLETSPLPAPYRNPWSSLADNLRAVVADVRLRFQEFWRRNGEGSLWLPNAWPRDLAPLFWPLVLGALVLVLVATAVMVTTLLSAAATGQSFVPEPQALSAGAEAEMLRSQAMAPGVSMPSPSTERPQSERPVATEEDPSQSNQPTSADPAASLSLEAPQPAEPDLLLSLVLGRETQASVAPDSDEMEVEGVEVDGMAVVLAADADSARNSVVITLRSAWSSLPTAQRQTLAETWWERMERAGYSALMLRSESGLVLGRSARVGQGMVLNPLPNL